MAIQPSPFALSFHKTHRRDASPPPMPPFSFSSAPHFLPPDLASHSSSSGDAVIAIDRDLSAAQTASLRPFRCPSATDTPARQLPPSLPPRPAIVAAPANRRLRLLNSSGLWVFVEAFVTLSQILAAIVVLALSQNERPETPLPVWVIGYAVGCTATLPLIYWRYTHHPAMEMLEREALPVQAEGLWPSNTMPLQYPGVSQMEASANDPASSVRAYRGFTRTTSIRIEMFMERLRVSLDCFFAVWFVLGNVWVFGRPSSAEDSPKLYRLCIAFLTLSCMSYAMPFILCAAVCCCLPCVISLVGLRESQVEGRGATAEIIAALPIYKFRCKRIQFRKEEADNNYKESDSDTSSDGGVMAAGTENERRISGDDAACCICLRRYRDNAELRGLPCSHHFHVDCVDQWLKINASCPLCKFALQGEFKDGEGQGDGFGGSWRPSRRLYEEV